MGTTLDGVPSQEAAFPDPHLDNLQHNSTGTPAEFMCGPPRDRDTTMAGQPMGAAPVGADTRTAQLA